MQQPKTQSEAARARSERMVFRVDIETRALVERAAELERRNLTDYCLTALSAAAQETLARHETLRLTEAERSAFFDVLLDPPEPNDRLMRAVAAARRRVTQLPERGAADLAIMPLRDEHDRAGFACGVESLDRYLKAQGGQDMRRKANAVFVLTGLSEPSTILGYTTLCATSLEQGDVPEAARKHIPRYPAVSATLLGRLAVASAHQGEGLGAVLLADALRRAYDSASSVGSSMVVVDALHAQAVGFYEAHGFIRLGPASQRLVLPMHTIGRALRQRV